MFPYFLISTFPLLLSQMENEEVVNEDELGIEGVRNTIKKIKEGSKKREQEKNIQKGRDEGLRGIDSEIFSRIFDMQSDTLDVLFDIHRKTRIFRK